MNSLDRLKHIFIKIFFFFMNKFIKIFYYIIFNTNKFEVLFYLFIYLSFYFIIITNIPNIFF